MFVWQCSCVDLGAVHGCSGGSVPVPIGDCTWVF